MKKVVKMSLNGKTSGNGTMDRIFMILKKAPGVIMTLPWGYIHVILHVCEYYSQTNVLVYISDLR